MKVYSKPSSSVVPMMVGLPFIGFGCYGAIFADNYFQSAAIVFAGACIAFYNATTMLYIRGGELSLYRLFFKIWTIPIENLIVEREKGPLRGAYAVYIFRDIVKLEGHSILQNLFREDDIKNIEQMAHKR